MKTKLKLINILTVILKIDNMHVCMKLFRSCFLFFSSQIMSQKLIHLYQHISALTNYIEIPVIKSKSKFYAAEGDEVQLTCLLNVSTKMPYTAAFSHNNVVLKTDEHMTVSKLEHTDGDRHESHFNLTINSFNQERDAGDYKCTVMDYYNNTNSAIATLTFFSDPSVTFNPTFSVVSIENGRKQASFMVKYSAYPPPTFVIFNPHSEQISSDMDVMNRIKYDVKIEDDRIKFVIKFPDINDYGIYKLVGMIASKNFTQDLKLVVSRE
jgi:hypothetical protein